MHLHPKLLLVSSLCALSALALPAVAAQDANEKKPASSKAEDTASADKIAALEKQLEAFSTIEQKLDFLKNNIKGQSLSSSATLGAYIIQTAPASTQNDVAARVSQVLAGSTGDTPQISQMLGQLSSKLTPAVASSVAGSLINGAASSAPTQLPKITAAVIVSQPSTIANAGPIAQQVTNAAPLEMASKIATAIGQAYTENPTLIAQAPTIAADMTKAIITKGTDAQVAPAVGDSVAALSVLLPGDVATKKAEIANIGKAVSGVITENHPTIVPTVIATTSNALTAANGPSTPSTPSTAKPTIDLFTKQFIEGTSNPVLQQQFQQAANNPGAVVGNTPAATPAPSTEPTPAPSAAPTPAPSAAPTPPPNDVPVSSIKPIGQNTDTGNFTYPTPPPPTPTPTPTPAPTPQATPPQETNHQTV